MLQNLLQTNKQPTNIKYKIQMDEVPTTAVIMS